MIAPFWQSRKFFRFGRAIRVASAVTEIASLLRLSLKSRRFDGHGNRVASAATEIASLRQLRKSHRFGCHGNRVASAVTEIASLR